MRQVANRSVPYCVERGESVDGYGNLWGRVGDEVYVPFGTWLSDRMYQIFRIRVLAGTISAAIYSYDTPIAWCDQGVWVQPDVYYTRTTSKHWSYLRGYNLIPGDCSNEEYFRIIDRKMKYVRQGKNLKSVPIR